MSELKNYMREDRLTLKMAMLEKKISDIERRGAKIKPFDLFSLAFFATITSAVVVFGIVILILLKLKVFF